LDAPVPAAPVVGVAPEMVVLVGVGGSASVSGGSYRTYTALLSNSRRVPEFGDGCLPTRFCLDQGL